MMHFRLTKYSSISRDKLYAISTDVKNFSRVMPKYFESIIIIESVENQIFADEKIRFLGTSLKVKTKHVTTPPNIHEVHIMSGMLRGSFFIERYENMPKGTNVIIDVSLNFNVISKIFSPFKFLIKRKMDNIMNEFLKSAKTMS